MNALKTYLVPIFEPTSNLSVTCPTNKADDISEFLRSRGWKNLQLIPESKLSTLYSASSSSSNKSEKEEKGGEGNVPYAGVCLRTPGAFAAALKCQCPKCGRGDEEQE